MMCRWMPPYNGGLLIANLVEGHNCKTYGSMTAKEATKVEEEVQDKKQKVEVRKAASVSKIKCNCEKTGGRCGFGGSVMYAQEYFCLSAISYLAKDPMEANQL